MRVYLSLYTYFLDCPLKSLEKRIALLLINKRLSWSIVRFWMGISQATMFYNESQWFCFNEDLTLCQLLSTWTSDHLKHWRNTKAKLSVWLVPRRRAFRTLQENFWVLCCILWCNPEQGWSQRSSNWNFLYFRLILVTATHAQEYKYIMFTLRNMAPLWVNCVNASD